MTFTKVCSLDDLGEGEMESFEVDGQEILMVWPEGGELKAFQGICPHQDIPLIEGKFDGKTVICPTHLWQFDACSGKGINPLDCALAQYPLKIGGEAFFC
uniref:Ferredoxin n=1 Tax=Burkholderia cepacia TaxID=292 RepID=O07070_BURCE|nr:ferredoxin [Burkholderia cepacia]